MRALDASECAQWCGERGIDASTPRRLRFATADARTFRIPLPTKGLKVVALSIVLSRAGKDEHHPQSLLWLIESGMWSESFEEIGSLVWQDLLAAHGLARTTAGVLFDESELVEQRAFLTMLMLFQWDAALVPDHARYFAQISHDEYVDMVAHGDAPDELAEFRSAWS